MEYGHKVVSALREISKDWSKYEKVIVGTEALDAKKYQVPQVAKYTEWKDNIASVANFLADSGGGTDGSSDGILSQTNHIARMGFMGILGREDMSKKQLTELSTAKILQDTFNSPADIWNALNLAAPTTPAEIE